MHNDYNFFEGREKEIIEELIDNDITLTDIFNHKVSFSRVPIAKLPSHFDTIFLKVKGYENDEYDICSGAVETEEGWDYYVFCYQKEDEEERKYKKDLIEDRLKNRFD